MPPKRSSSRACHSKAAAQPRRAPASTGARSATKPFPKPQSKAQPPSNQTTSTASTPTPVTNTPIPVTSVPTPAANPSTPGPFASCGSQAPTSPPPRTRIGTANTNTPNRRSGCSRSAPFASARNSGAAGTPQSEIVTATPCVVTQPEMDVYIESELHNAIFHDPKFVERFLSGAANKLQDIEYHCRVNNQQYNDTHEWPLPKDASAERALYRPILNVLNTIKRAVDHIHPPYPSPITAAAEEPPQLFLDNSNSAIPSDLADTAQIKPDLVLFQDSHRHWENVRMPIEVKLSPGLHKVGMKRLSRYARATFAHQLHRRHLYAMMICGTEATFVRFDRAGILYSKRVDLVKDAEAFTRAFASLLMLDRIDEGYDPVFTFERGEDGRLIYYIDLPESAFVRTFRKPTTTEHNNRTRRFKVIEILCHRESICGRATIVLRIREDPGAEGQDPEEYALKVIWRDPERGSEGEILEQIHGRFGLAQSIWHCDVSIPGKCKCPAPVETGCTKCVDKTVQVDGLQVCDKLRDVSIVVPPEVEGEKQEFDYVDTTECRPTSYVRPLRVYSYILMASIGVPLWKAESPRQYLTAVLDAILGYWGAFNIGIMHRDISDGNVMMLEAGQTFTKREWLEPRTEGPHTLVQDDLLVESEAKLRSILEEIGHRDPTGMLSDFDLHTMHSSISNHATTSTATSNPNPTESSPVRSSGRRLEEESATPEPSSKRRKTNSHTATPIVANGHSRVVGEEPQAHSQREKRRVIDFRTGTPAFMSTGVLKVKPGVPYHHHFLDDLESFFWLMLWSAAAHLDEGQDYPTPEAQAMLDYLNQGDLQAMWGWKRGILLAARFTELTEETLGGFGNEWGSDSMISKVICDLGCLLTDTTREQGRRKLEKSPGGVFHQIARIFLDALSSGE